MSSNDHVRLQVPASADFLGLAALCASRVGRSVGLGTSRSALFAADVAAECSRLLDDSHSSVTIDYRIDAEMLLAEGRSPEGGRFRVVAERAPLAAGPSSA